MLPYDPLRHYDELIAEAIAQRFPIVGRPAYADRVRAVQLLQQRGLNVPEIAMRLRTSERAVQRMARTEVEPMPEYDPAWLDNNELVKGIA